ncbi:hypothetical protein NKH18_27035 [Streptomyces sp. M10(2022)]
MRPSAAEPWAAARAAGPRAPGTPGHPHRGRLHRTLHHFGITGSRRLNGRHRPGLRGRLRIRPRLRYEGLLPDQLPYRQLSHARRHPGGRHGRRCPTPYQRCTGIDAAALRRMGISTDR